MSILMIEAPQTTFRGKPIFEACRYRRGSNFPCVCSF